MKSTAVFPAFFRFQAAKIFPLAWHISGTLYFGKEILIAPEERGFALAETLIHAGMRFSHAKGYRESCGEIYYVSAFRNEKGERPVHLFNNASYRMLKHTGCRLEGAFQPCVAHADGFDVVLPIRIVR